jgi:tetratricopeptide (TPR) repeat protein
MAADFEARIQELKERVESAPGSRFFVPLAEEYRKAGRLPEAIRALEEGLITHPGYVAARVALARAYLEVGKVEESMTAFSKALADDPSNLVAAKALGDLHLSRGEPIEALKRYLRYRGISGDRRVDAVIARLQEETAPAVKRSPHANSAPPPPAFPLPPMEPLAPVEVPAALTEPFVPPGYAPIAPAARPTDPHDISGVEYERPSIPPAAGSALEAPAVPSRDLPLASITSTRRDDEIVTRKIRLPEANWPFEARRPPPAPPAPEKPKATAAENLPTPESEGRTLADLYLEQGHHAEARDLYAALLAVAPGDEELRRLRDEAARRADAPPPALPPADPARERRLAKIRILNEWLAVLDTGSGTGHR